MDEALLSIVGVAALGLVDKKITERLVKWFSFLKGDLITLASVLVGWVLAWLFAIDPTSAIATAVGKPIAVELPEIALYLIAGVVIAFAAGEFADRVEARTGAVVVPGEGQVPGAVAVGAGSIPLHGDESHIA